MHDDIETKSTRDLLVSLIGEHDTDSLYHGSLHILFETKECVRRYSTEEEKHAHFKLKAAHELVRRLLEESLHEGALLSDPNAVRSFVRITFCAREREVFALLFLDARHRYLGHEVLFYGTIDAAAVYPREVVKSALARNAAAVIAVHNHVSGHPEPSLADRALTRRLIEALSVVDIRVLDHLVVGREGTVSFAERGWV